MKPLKPLLLPLVCFLAFVGAAHLHIVAHRQAEKDAGREQVRKACISRAEALRAVLEGLAKAPEGLAVLIAQGAPVEGRLPVLASYFRTVFPALGSLGLAPGGVLSEMYPLAGHECLRGIDFLSDPRCRQATQQALQNGQAVVVGPFDFCGGALRMVGVAPVYSHEEGGFWGMAASTAGLENVLAAAGLHDLQDGMVYRLLSDGKSSSGGWFLSGHAEAFPENVPRYSAELPLADGVLVLTIAQVGGESVRTYQHEYAAAVALGLFLSAGIGLLLARRGRGDRQNARLRSALANGARRLAARATEARRQLDVNNEATAYAASLFEDDPAVRLIGDPATLHFVDANPAAAAFYGYSREAMRGLPLAAINMDDPETMRARIAAALGGLCGPARTTHRLASGGMRNVEIYLGPIMHGGKRLVQAVVLDVTERVDTLLTLQRTQARMEAVFETLDCALAEVDRNGRFVLSNAACAEMFGMPREELRRVSYEEFIPPEDRPTLRGIHDDLMSGRIGKCCFQQRFIRANDGAMFWGNLCASVLRGPDGEPEGVVAAVTDVTTLLDAARKAQEASEVKSRFLAGVSHELRSPLNAVLGLTELTLRGNLEPGQRSKLEKALAAGRVLLTTISDILEYSSLEVGGAELDNAPFALGLVHDTLSDRFAPLAKEKGLDLVLRLEGVGARSRLLGDAGRLTRLLGCLLENSIKFTERGKVELRIEAKAPRDGFVRLRFSLSDTGAGMDAAQIDRLMLPFTQGDSSLTRRHAGTGLGLAIAKRLADLLDLSLDISSTPGSGTVTTLRGMMLVADAAARRSAVRSDAAPAEGAAGLEGTRILVVDDNQMSRQATMEMLRWGGLAAVEADGGGQALRLLAEASFDVILLDLRMPDMDGYELYERMRSGQGWRLRPTPVVALTGIADQHEVKTCLQRGMAACLIKPVDPRALYETLRTVLKASATPLPVLNREAALAMLMGNRALYARLLKGFARDYADAGETVAQHMEHARRKEAAEVVEAVMGLAGNLGGERLRAEAERLLRVLEDGRSEIQAAAGSAFQHEVRHFLDAAREEYGAAGPEG